LADNKNPQQRRNVEIEDLYRFRLVSDPQVSSDGHTVAYVQTRLRKKKNDYAANIWLVPADGSGEPNKLTNSAKRDMSPRWSPVGGELAFISTRSGKSQIWVIRVGGGEARQLTRIKRGVGELEWSPDGHWIAFTSEVDNELDKKIAEEAKAKGGKQSEGGSSDSENREPGATGEEGFVAMQPPTDWAEDDEDEDEKEPEDKGEHAKVFTRLHIKSDGQGLDERRSHLFIVPAKGGKPRQLTEGDFDVQALRWSPDGKQLAFVSNQDPEADYHNIQDIFVMPIENGEAGEMRRVTGHDHAIGGISWLPTGDGFAIYAHRRINEAALATNMQVWTVSLEGEVRVLTEGFDRPAGSWVNSDLRGSTGPLRPLFSADGATIYFSATNGGAAQIFSVPLQGGEVKEVVVGERQVLSFDVAADGLVFSATTATHPNDIYRADFDGGNERALTDVNRDVLGELAVSEPRELWVERPDGTRLQGWMLLPPGYEEGTRYPMVLEIHGGPHTAYGGAYMHEFQLLAARGNIVLYTNPRGSLGYGQEFADAILNDWGGVDYDDLMAFVDYVIEQGFVDENRMGVAGGSYGGYMSAWIIGHTQRFKAAVASRLVSNLYSAWGNGDFTWMLWSWEFEGTPQQRTALYLERSPVTYVEQMHTPLLLTHAADDLRTNVEQADQMYTALKVLKRNVKMVRFPSGGHDISRTGKPSLRVQRLEHILDWFDQYMNAGAEE
jgi:dipeptidyl aminopeptidase/acylaminoacyl peptidase